MMYGKRSSGRISERSSWPKNRSRMFRMFSITSFVVIFSLFFMPLIAKADSIQESGVNATIPFSKYYIQNNEWDNQYNGWGAGYQSISHDTNNDSTGAWSTSFNWWNVQSDDPWHIKAWPNIVQGWDWGQILIIADYPYNFGTTTLLRQAGTSAWMAAAITGQMLSMISGSTTPATGTIRLMRL